MSSCALLLSRARSSWLRSLRTVSSPCTSSPSLRSLRSLSSGGGDELAWGLGVRRVRVTVRYSRRADAVQDVRSGSGSDVVVWVLWAGIALGLIAVALSEVRGDG